TGIESFAGFVSYTTETPFWGVVVLYKTEMAAAGWNLDSEFSAEPDALLTFSNSDGTVVLVSVTLGLDGVGLMVSIF
ncbi:MAG: hypothetical protein R3335_07070, partial [Anaerolineales bacterium]|nr:hypothetical protein [Anaerolineales bacterium]